VECDRPAGIACELVGLGLSTRGIVAGYAGGAGGLARAGERFDCVLLDPPYGGDFARQCVETLAPGEILSENAVLLVQAFHKTDLPARTGTLSRAWQRRYGETRLTLYRKESECP
jgi:16S rRNA G966 N2-methylase RsmD